MNDKMLLVQPAVPYTPMSSLGPITLEPLALEYIAGCLQNDIDSIVIDLRVQNDNLETWIARERPSIVGFSCSSFQVESVRSMIKRVRQVDDEVAIVAGGYHVNLQPQEFIGSEVDYCCLGDGVSSMREVISLVRQRAVSGSRPCVVRSRLNLNYPILYPLRSRLGLPFHAYQFAGEGPAGLVQTSSGCSFRCTYCDVIAFNDGKYFARQTELILADICDVSAENIVFADDETFLDHKTMSALAAALKTAGARKRFFASTRATTIVRHPELMAEWRECGLEGVFIGIDAIEQETLNKFQKKSTTEEIERAIVILHDLGVRVFANFIILPTFLPEDFDRVYRFITRHRVDVPSLTILTPMPGTPLWEQFSAELLADSKMDLAHSVLQTRMPREEFHEQVECLREKVREWVGRYPAVNQPLSDLVEVHPGCQHS
jgi:hopanoid C-3 methylase